MTVANQTNRTSATGSGSGGQAVAFSFPITDTSDLKVYQRVTATGVETLLTETTNYTVSITGDTGGTVTTVTAVAASAQIHIYRDTPSTQALDLAAGGTFNAENLEDALDKTTKLTIENVDVLTRTMRIPNTDATSINMELPSSIDRASKYLTFDSDGEPAVTVDKTTGTASFSAFGETLVDDANAAAAQTTLKLKDSSASLDVLELTTGALSSSSVYDVTHTDYGADSTGTADSTAEIQAAIDAASAAGGGIVYFPEGTYSINASLTLKSNVALVGVGNAASLLDFDAAAAAVAMLDGASAVLSRVTIQGLGIDGNDKATMGIEIDYTGGSMNAFVRVVDCNIHNLATHGIHYEYIRNSVIEKSTIHTCADDGIYLDTTAKPFTSLSIVDTWIHTITDDGLVIGDTEAFNTLSLRNVYFEGIGGNGMTIDAASSEATMDCLHFENVTGDGIYLNAALYATIHGALFNTVGGKGIHSNAGASRLVISAPRFTGVTGNDIDFGGSKIVILAATPDDLDLASTTIPYFYDYNARTIVNKTANYSINFYEYGKTFTNSGAGGDVTFTLPIISADDIGMDIQFICATAGNDVYLDPGNASMSIRPTVTTNGWRLKNTGSAVGDSVKLKAISTTVWAIVAEKGTWTDAGS